MKITKGFSQQVERARSNPLKRPADGAWRAAAAGTEEEFGEDVEEKEDVITRKREWERRKTNTIPSELKPIGRRTETDDVRPEEGEQEMHIDLRESDAAAELWFNVDMLSEMPLRPATAQEGRVGDPLWGKGWHVQNGDKTRTMVAVLHIPTCGEENIDYYFLRLSKLGGKPQFHLSLQGIMLTITKLSFE
ncbi:hypothetical protein NDU88_004861 [Pleurodeles waltl]|uniref:Uncharacterized protein n=1 Tax=Pleurodeles waltl TaxID=8319 RepID=A0AAV7TVL6_PLEWA|nr:hypothetical protein NDU88_004861 [Pleurodeles waltl]